MNPFSIVSLRHELNGKVELRISAIIGDQMVGVAAVTEYGSPASTIYGLYVDPKWRRKGIGAQLIIEAESQVIETGGTAISAIVDIDGPLEWWINRGFKVVQCESGRNLVARILTKRATFKELQNASE